MHPLVWNDYVLAKKIVPAALVPALTHTSFIVCYRRKRVLPRTMNRRLIVRNPRDVWSTCEFHVSSWYNAATFVTQVTELTGSRQENMSRRKACSKKRRFSNWSKVGKRTRTVICAKLFGVLGPFSCTGNLFSLTELLRSTSGRGVGPMKHVIMKKLSCELIGMDTAAYV